MLTEIILKGHCQVIANNIITIIYVITLNYSSNKEIWLCIFKNNLVMATTAKQKLDEFSTSPISLNSAYKLRNSIRAS